VKWRSAAKKIISLLEKDYNVLTIAEDQNDIMNPLKNILQGIKRGEKYSFEWIGKKAKSWYDQE